MRERHLPRYLSRDAFEPGRREVQLIDEGIDAVARATTASPWKF
jgi:hypothetical protein